LYYAIKQNDNPLFWFIIENNIYVPILDEEKLLHTAAMFSDSTIIEFLIRDGFNVNYADSVDIIVLGLTNIL